MKLSTEQLMEKVLQDMKRMSPEQKAKVRQGRPGYGCRARPHKMRLLRSRVDD
jgi:hypothetical protein